MTTTITPTAPALRTVVDASLDAWLDLVTVDLTPHSDTDGPFALPVTLDWGRAIPETDGAPYFPAAWYDETPTVDAWLTQIATAR